MHTRFWPVFWALPKPSQSDSDPSGKPQNLFCSQVKVNPRLFRLKPIDVGIPSHDIFEVPMEGNILQR